MRRYPSGRMVFGWINFLWVVLVGVFALLIPDGGLHVVGAVCLGVALLHVLVYFATDGGRRRLR